MEEIIDDGEERRHVADRGRRETSRIVSRFKFGGVYCSRAGFGSLWVSTEKGTGTCSQIGVQARGTIQGKVACLPQIWLHSRQGRDDWLRLACAPKVPLKTGSHFLVTNVAFKRLTSGRAVAGCGDLLPRASPSCSRPLSAFFILWQEPFPCSHPVHTNPVATEIPTCVLLGPRLPWL